jgi:outer membrane biosynthesis protein TonB
LVRQKTRRRAPPRAPLAQNPQPKKPQPKNPQPKNPKPKNPQPKNPQPKNQSTQEFEGRIAYYPYMRMRQRAEYPWGGANGLFESHPRVVPDGEEPEEHH